MNNFWNTIDAARAESLHLSRRTFLQFASTGMAALATRAVAQPPADATANRVELPALSDSKTEAKEQPVPPSAPPAERVGFAIIGLGHIAIDQALPALAECKYARPAAVMSGQPDKARRIARQYGIPETSIYNYNEYDRLRADAGVRAVYIALPNGLHAESTARSAAAGKHVLCEKPMAVSVAECQQMIDACRQAGVKLMIAYRSQYEPLDREIVKLVRDKKLGTLREFVSANSQREGDAGQWRLNQKLAGGGPVPDVGIYCMNAARFMSGEEPVEVFAQTFQPAGDRRFREVEATAQFLLKFPSGFTATCSCGYDSHRSQFLRLQGTDGWAELSPAFAYQNLRLRVGQKVEDHDTSNEIMIAPKNQFAAEFDHMAECIINNKEPHTPGEEGLQDMRIVAAIYESARTGQRVRLDPPARRTRGPEPAEHAS